MTDIDKIVREAETRHTYKEWRKANNLQLKDFIYGVLLPLLVCLSPLIVAIIMKVASI